MKLTHRVLSAALSAVIAVGAFSAAVPHDVAPYSFAEAASAPSKPVASLKAGTYNVSGSKTVSLSCDTKGADIYYSINGADYKKYSSKIKISKNTTLKFYSELDGEKSKTVTNKYKLTPKLTISHKNGTYKGTQIVKISSKLSGVELYYTLDGSKPTADSSAVPADGIRITKSCKLRILAVKKDWTSYLASRKYTIKPLKAESILDSYTKKYAYSTLTAAQKQLYKALYNGISSHQEQIDVKACGCTQQDLAVAYSAVDMDNPQFIHLTAEYGGATQGNTVVYVKPVYNRTSAEVKTALSAISKKVDTIVAGAMEQPDLFERVVYIHDSIADACKISSGSGIRLEADGALKNGIATSEGYAKAFAYLCQSVGIEAVCVTGKYSGSEHVWNMVKLDGSWYHIDVAADDPTGYQLKSHYDYFGLTDKDIKADHKPVSAFALPSATATKYNYIKQLGCKVFSDTEKAYEYILKQSAANYKKGIFTTTVAVDGGAKALEGTFTVNRMSFVDALTEMDLGFEKIAEYGYRGEVFWVTLK